MKASRKTSGEIPVLLFAQAHDLDAWLDENHASSPGIWLRIAKKGAGLQSVSYAEAIEVALCHGWIDGQKKAYDESSWLQKLTPRGPASLWSKVNREKAEELIQSGRMKPAGRAAVERAQQTGRWEAAYDSASRATVPSDLQAALDAHPEAKAFFETLDGTNRYAVLFRIQTAKKAETRTRRIQQFVAMLERHEKLYS